MSELTEWAESFATEASAPELVTEWVDRTCGAIEDSVAEIGRNDLSDALRAAVEEHWLAFLGQVLHDEQKPFELVDAARVLVVEAARRHLDLPVVLQVYRVAQESSWDYAIDVVRQAPSAVDHEALLVWLWGRAVAWFNSSIEQSVLVHQAETQRIRQRGDADRYQVVAGLLADRPAEPADVAAALGGYPVSGSHVALVAHAPTADDVAGLEPAVLELARRGSAGQPLVVRPGGRELWAWLPARSLPAVPAEDPAGPRITLGGPARGLDGFVTAHRDAVVAQRVALAPGWRRRVTAYADVAALALIAQDQERAERFARDVLGGLAAPEADVLRSTVRVVLTTPGGSAAIAARLNVHANTVRYRIGQAERLLGFPLASRAGDLLLALDYVEAFLG